MKFTKQKLYEIQKKITKELQTYNEISFEVLNPDILNNNYNGTIYIINEEEYIHRSYKTWVDLAQILSCNMQTPKIVSEYTVKITYGKLNKKTSFHNDNKSNEKYGIQSEFFNINKNEEISFLHYYTQALKNIKIDNRLRVLNLGINKGDEFDIIKDVSSNFSNIEFVGIDYSSSAIEFAKERFKNKSNMSFIKADINKLDELDLGKFDLIISIGTLQSSSLNFKLLFASLVQNYLKNNGAMILAFPNCRWIDGSMIYGAMVKNYNYSELSNLYSDAIYCKKYLQQKKFRVTLTGKDYIFLSASSIRK
jgi:SAM-dependent methyltransferase